MLLRNLHVICNNDLSDIFIDGEKIKSVSPSQRSNYNSIHQINLDFGSALAFPGLINSHDHLDFNLFPPIRNDVYRNYAEWGKDIHQNNKETINAILKIPQKIRTAWGLYKNLLNGITTVVNHGEYLNCIEDLITVFQNCHCLHSVAFEKWWRFKINRPDNNRVPVVMHLGEGADDSSKKEINEVVRWNFFGKAIIAVHGVAMDEKQADHFKALVWCPVSNLFLLSTTARINKLKEKIPIIFGTDSTLTADWNVWEHLRLARQLSMISDKELYQSLTNIPAAIWGLDHIGRIESGKQADLVIAKNKNGQNDFDSFYNLNAEDLLFILHKGNIRFFDAELHDQLHESQFKIKNFSKIYINGVCKYVMGNLPALIDDINKYKVGLNAGITY